MGPEDKAKLRLIYHPQLRRKWGLGREVVVWTSKGGQAVNSQVDEKEQTFSQQIPPSHPERVGHEGSH